MFLNVILPNILSAGNLPAISGKAECIYKVFTCSKSAKSILNNEFFQRVQQIMRTEVVTLNHLFRENDYLVPPSILLMTQCHRLATAMAAKEDAALFFIQPDAVWSDGTFEKAHEIAADGKRAIMCIGPRVSKETFLPEFTQKFLGREKVFCAPSRPLVNLALHHLHPVMNSCFINSGKFTTAPTTIFWPVANEGLLAKSLHLHTLMIYPRHKKAFPISAMDTDFLLSAGIDIDEFHIVTDSDEIVAFEMSERNKYARTIGNSGIDISKLTKFFKTHEHKIHYEFLKKAIYLHAVEMSPLWEKTKRSSDSFMNPILRSIHKKTVF